MSHNMYMSYRAVACIQKPPEERTDEEIGGLVPWLRNMSRVLADAKQGTSSTRPDPQPLTHLTALHHPPYPILILSSASVAQRSSSTSCATASTRAARPTT